ncbi:hypothetical protein ACE106_13170 [Shouchella clausii]|uniref:hypothetical protein n=1 Tax=Shouchella clausii TaxID=79880 RepID=UPI00289BEDE7|nr:hypothetical protein [Shouchella clausii]
MKPFMRCTTEEWMLLLTMCGYEVLAKSLGEEVFGEKSEESWETLFECAAHQLMLKGVWDDEKASKDEVPLADGLQSFIRSVAEAKQLIRLSNPLTNEALLFRRIGDNQWIEHYIKQEIIQEFHPVDAKSIEKNMHQFIEYKDLEPSNEIEFTMSNGAFTALSDQRHVKEVKTYWLEATRQNEEWFDEFAEALLANEWKFFNTSVMHVSLDGEQTETNLNDLLFHMPARDGVWFVRYKDVYSNEDVIIQKISFSKWKEVCNEFLERTVFHAAK